MASYNRVVLVGNVARDVPLRYTNSGVAVTDVDLAVNDRRKDPNGDGYLEWKAACDRTLPIRFWSHNGEKDEHAKTLT